MFCTIQEAVIVSLPDGFQPTKDVVRPILSRVIVVIPGAPASRLLD